MVIKVRLIGCGKSAFIWKAASVCGDWYYYDILPISVLERDFLFSGWWASHHSNKDWREKRTSEDTERCTPGVLRVCLFVCLFVCSLPFDGRPYHFTKGFFKILVRFSLGICLHLYFVSCILYLYFVCLFVCILADFLPIKLTQYYRQVTHLINLELICSTFESGKIWFLSMETYNWKDTYCTSKMMVLWPGGAEEGVRFRVSRYTNQVIHLEFFACFLSSFLWGGSRLVSVCSIQSWSSGTRFTLLQNWRTCRRRTGAWGVCRQVCVFVCLLVCLFVCLFIYLFISLLGNLSLSNGCSKCVFVCLAPWESRFV